MELTHVDKNGQARMVDVSQKAITERTAVASATVKMKPATLTQILEGKVKKGDVFACARIAGIMAAKRTPELIPLCHPIPLTHVSVDLQAYPPENVKIITTVKCTYVTGVEMEALCAASVAALTIYDMCKSIDRSMEIVNIGLVSKTGGKSGDFLREKGQVSH